MTTKYHPSNRLYSGEVTEFCEAMNLVLAECAYEMPFAASNEPDDVALRQTLQEFQQAAAVALTIWQQCSASRADGDALKEAVLEQLCAHMEQESTPEPTVYLRMIVECLKTDEYNDLAI
jgi:hypothetical protein